MGIDINLIKRIDQDQQLKKRFIYDFVNILNRSGKFDSCIIAGLCKDKKIRKVVIDNLGLVLSKMNRCGEFIIYLTNAEIKKNVKFFFNSDRLGVEIIPVFNTLVNRKTLPTEQILELFADNIEKIFNGVGMQGIYLIMDQIPNFKSYGQENLSIRKIDNFLASKVEEISQKSFYYGTFDFNFFNEMKEFKAAIGKKGADFFIKFPIDYDTSFEECRKIAKSVFGEFTSENFTKIKYGQNDEKRALVIQTIIDELLEQAGDGASMLDVKKQGEGHYSTVYRIGNYVLKVGTKRHNYTIPNHRRILKPVIRTYIGGSTIGRNNIAIFVEVQNLVETEWWKGMEEEEIEEVLFSIYSEIRDDGLIWMDVKRDNIGRLLKQNTSNVLYLDIDGKRKELKPNGDATGILGEEHGIKLKKGDYVIVDSDYIVKYEEWVKMQEYYPGEVCREKWLEERYQANQAKLNRERQER